MPEIKTKEPTANPIDVTTGASVKEDRNYGGFQNTIYAAGMLAKQFPLVTTDPNKLEAQAKKALPSTAYNYVAGGAGEGATMIANRLAFTRWKIVPRMLRPTGKRDLHVDLFGERYGKYIYY